MAPLKSIHVSLRLTDRQRKKLTALAAVNELTNSAVLTTLLERAPLDLVAPILEGLRHTTEQRAQYEVPSD